MQIGAFQFLFTLKWNLVCDWGWNFSSVIGGVGQKTPNNYLNSWMSKRNGLYVVPACILYKNLKLFRRKMQKSSNMFDVKEWREWN